MNNTIANHYVPDYVSLPGETLLDVLEEREMSQAELAERTGRPKKTISEIINGKAAITADTALQLERVLGIPARFWNEREKTYQDFLARQKEAHHLQSKIDWLSQFPIRAMVSMKWIKGSKDKVIQIQILLNFFAVASPEKWESYWGNRPLAYRKSAAFVSDQAAITAWLRKGELEADLIQCQPYNSSKFKKALTEIRKLTKLPLAVLQRKGVDLCAEAGVALVFIPELPKTRVSGVTRWLSTSKAVIQVSSRYKTNDHLWFTLFHEAGHVFQDKKNEFFFEGVPEHDPNHPSEQDANTFSTDFLIPPEAIENFLLNFDPKCLASVSIEKFADELDMHPGIVVGRLQHDGYLPRNYCNELKESLKW